jgi:GR25 family glycosyltransferase involved in LPS biosynthesis
MMKSLFLSVLASVHFLSADVMDHLKIVTDEKAKIHCMKNIDFIYMINLDERPEKLETSLKKLSHYRIYPFRFSAVNGWKLSLETINDVGVKYSPWMTGGQWGTCYLIEERGEPHHEMITEIGRTYFGHCVSRGAIGIVLSHLSTLKDAYDSGYETIWVMEDDIEIIRDPHLISEQIEKLDRLVGKGGWDILFTDRDTKNAKGNYVPCQTFAWRPNFSPEDLYQFAEVEDLDKMFRRIGARYGAYSMIVRRSGMKKLLDFFTLYQVFLPYDMELPQVPEIRLFTVQNDIVSTQPDAVSDNGAPYYENKEMNVNFVPDVYTQNASYVEYITSFDAEETFQIKQNVFSMMHHLEGWCSYEKASILVDLVFKTQPDTIVEIGVFGGKSLIPMAYALKVLGKGKAYGVDPWDGKESIQGMMSPIDREWWGNLDHLEIMHGLVEKIKEFELQEYIYLIPNTSSKAQSIEDIDILHIDGNHAEEICYHDVLKWVPLVKEGGWIIFNDIAWNENGQYTTARAVEWLNTHCIKFAEFNKSWGIWIKQ